MNLNTLNYLIKNAEEIIIESAEENGLIAENVLGVANQVVGEKSTQMTCSPLINTPRC